MATLPPVLDGHFLGTKGRVIENQSKPVSTPSKGAKEAQGITRESVCPHTCSGPCLGDHGQPKTEPGEGPAPKGDPGRERKGRSQSSCRGEMWEFVTLDQFGEGGGARRGPCC